MVQGGIRSFFSPAPQPSHPSGAAPEKKKKPTFSSILPDPTDRDQKNSSDATIKIHRVILTKMITKNHPTLNSRPEHNGHNS